MDNFFCSNSNVSNMYHNDAKIYRIKKNAMRAVLIVTKFA